MAVSAAAAAAADIDDDADGDSLFPGHNAALSRGILGGEPNTRLTKGLNRMQMLGLQVDFVVCDKGKVCSHLYNLTCRAPN